MAGRGSLRGPGDDLLRMAEPVDCGGVDPVDAGVQCLPDGGDGILVVLAPQANSQPEPPIAHAPKPIGVMCRSEFPSCFVSIIALSFIWFEVPLEAVARRQQSPSSSD